MTRDFRLLATGQALRPRPLTGVFALLIWAYLTSIALFLGIAVAAQLEAIRGGQRRPAEPDPEPTAAHSHRAR